MGAGIDAQMIARLLRPKSVAVVGASDKPGALGASVLSNLDGNGFAGEVYPINPNRETIGARTCLASIDQLPEGVDVAVLAVPQSAVLEAVQGLAARKCGAAIIYASGFAEGGEEGLAQQAELARIAADCGMVIEGPNCLGPVNHVDGIPLTFVQTQCRAPKLGQGIGVVSQSGAMAAVLCTTLQARELDISYSVSTGNEAGSGVEDYVDWLIDEPNTKVIAMLVEQFRKPQRFLAAARRAIAAGKPIVLLHPGKSSAARESAATHTGAMAGDYKLMRALVERAGVIFAETLEELGDIAEILLRCPGLAGTGLAVLGESGAFKALTLDLAEDLGLPLVDLRDDNAPELRIALPPFVPVSNPLDITAQGLSQPAIYTDCLNALFNDDRVGAVVCGIIQGDPITSRIKVPAILASLETRKLAKPLIFAGLDEGAEIPRQYVAALRAAGVPWFPATERAFRALSRLTRHAMRDLADATPAAIPLAGLAAQSGPVPEYRSKDLLAPLGIQFPQRRFASSADEAAASAQSIGFPVAMKAQAAALGHKSDAGGVLLGLASAEEVRAAWVQIHSNVAEYCPTLALDGVLIEKMGKRGIELIVGAKNDPEWGPVVLAGFGGVTAEILQDVCLITPDMSGNAIKQALMELKQAPLFSGYRGSPALDLDSLIGLIRKILGIMLAEPKLVELDLNPVVLHPQGEGLIALDALMMVNLSAEHLTP